MIDPFDPFSTKPDTEARGRRALDDANDPERSPEQRAASAMVAGYARNELDRERTAEVAPSAAGDLARARADRLDEHTRHTGAASAHYRLAAGYADISADRDAKENS